MSLLPLDSLYVHSEATQAPDLFAQEEQISFPGTFPDVGPNAGAGAGTEDGPQTGLDGERYTAPASMEESVPEAWHSAADETGALGAEAANEPTLLTVDEFAALEERVLRAVALVQRERQARAAAEDRARLAEELLAERIAQQAGAAAQIERLQQEVDGLRAERAHVRTRVEGLLNRLDSLEL